MTKENDKKPLTPEQELVVKNKSKRLVVSASAGSGKTFVVVEKLIKLICEEKVPVSRLLVLTFTKAAASELKTRLYTEILNQKSNQFLIEQLDDIMISDISTIDSFCEKVVKRNINKLNIAQNFIVLDEKAGKTLKSSAFKRAFESFAKNQAEKFQNVFFAFKRNDEAIEECLFSIQSFFDSQKDGDILSEDFSNNLSIYHKGACNYLKQQIENSFKCAEKYIKDALIEVDIIGEKLAKGHLQFVDGMKKLLSIDLNEDLFALCKAIAEQDLPSLSTARCDGDIKKKFALAKDCLVSSYDIAKQLSFATDEMILSAENGQLSADIMQLYKLFAEEYRALKERRSALDFADLEKYALTLIQDDEVKKSLQEKYDYIIIDEYQDTNRLQEAILKPIAEGGYFIAVGDIKQGIYGFRNASKEIMSDDIKQFAKDQNSEALFLRGNFRTDARILEFVNQIFAKLMTESSVGINYQQTSMLEGKNKFLPNDLPAVSVDVVCNSTNESDEEKEVEKEDVWSKVYSVKEDRVEADYQFKDEIMTIAQRIDEALARKIYSPKLKAFRPVEEGDIALLFRNRSELMEECVKYLRSKGFSVDADIKENLLEDSQVSLLYALLKLSINLNDDVSLASVMASCFGGFGFNELAQIRKDNPEGSFYEIVSNLRDEKTNRFFEMISTFKFDISVFGIVKAFEKLFKQVGYMDFIDTFDDRQVKRLHINKLFALISSNGLDFFPQGVVSLMEKTDKENNAKSEGANSIIVTTIHATKGLEYPIVILCGAGESLTKAYNKNYIATKEYGLASNLFCYENNLKVPSPAFLAGKLLKKKAEFVDELMVFYVAMTRAQNHLYIIGSGKEKDYSFDDLAKQNSYLKLVFFALGENFKSQVFAQELVSNKNATFTLVSQIVDENQEKEIKEVVDLKSQENEKFQQKLEEFYAFEYPNKEFCKLSYKNSVTGVSKIQNDEEYKVGEVLYADEQSQSQIQQNLQDRSAREKAVEIGNSYHEALKLIDFNLVCDRKSIENEFERIRPFLSQGYAENIDLSLLLKNILTIKDVVWPSLLFKEREFIMQSTPEEIALLKDEKRQSLDRMCDNDLIVQGVVDLFAVGEKIVLVDYKYTSTRDEKTLINRYKGQINLYQLAIEKAFERKVDEKYLLSLKEAKLIKIE